MSAPGLVDEKRRELANQAAAALAPFGNNAPTIAMAVVEHFCRFVPPENQASMELIVMRVGGLGGGRSRKAGNILLNWRRLLVGASEGALAVAGLTQPWLLPLAALVIWNSLWSTLDLSIDEHHATVLWVLWSLRDNRNRVPKTSLPTLVNEKLAELHQAPLTPAQLRRSIADLERMECLESEYANEIWLREWVQVRWE